MLYQLRHYYTVSTSDLGAVTTFTGDQLLPGLAAHGVQTTACFTTVYGPSPRLSVLLGFADEGQRQAQQDAFYASDAWREMEPGLFPGGRPLVAGFDTSLLRPTPYSMDVQEFLNADSPGMFEERIYHGTSTRNHAKINARFAEHTTRIFPKHGIKVVGYWNVEVGTSQPALYYLVRYDALGDRDALWGNFRNDPEWQAVVAQTEAEGPIVRSIEAHILAPTSFSPLR